MTGHARFEMLAGAIALDEATPLERAEFAAHAADCAPCRADAEYAPAFVEAVAHARDAERWRPALGHAVFARIRDLREKRSRTTLGVLGWAIAISIVLNIAFVSGFAAHVATVLRPSSESVSTVVARRVTFDAHVDRVFVARPIRSNLPPEPAVRPGAKNVRARAHGVAAALRRPAPPRAGRTPRAVVPSADVLAGLDIDRPRDPLRRVALAPAARCAGSAQRAAGGLPGRAASENDVSDGDGSGSFDGAEPPLDACGPGAPRAAYSGSEAGPFNGSTSRK